MLRTNLSQDDSQLNNVSGGHTIALSTHVCIDMNNFNWLDGLQLETLDNGQAIEW